MKKKIIEQEVTDLSTEPQIPQKKKGRSKKKLVVIGILIVFVLFILFLIFRYYSLTPLENETFYTAVYQNKPVFFYKYPGMLLGLQPIGPYEGEIISYADAVSPMKINQTMDVNYVDFRKLQNPKKLFSFDRYATPINVRFSPDKTYLIMSFIGGPEDNINYIYQVNMKTSAAKKIWEHTLRTGNPPLNEGDAYITEFVPDRYVVFDIIQGDPPPDMMPIGTVIINMQTAALQTLGAAGDVKINLSTNLFSYKKIGRVKAPCTKDTPVCFPGDLYRYTYLPTGDIITQKLP